MERTYAFCYAVGDARHAGEIKIGEMSALSFDAARKKLTARYKTTYGRALGIYKLVPVGVPKRRAEDIIKRRLKEYHACGELYDLPPAKQEFDALLDRVFGELEVPMDRAHYVSRLETPEARKMRLKEERTAVNRREQERLVRKRQRLDEQEDQAIDKHMAIEAADAARDWAKVYPAIKRARDKLETERRANAEDEADGVAAWASHHVRAEEGGHITLSVAHEHFMLTGAQLSKLRFSKRLQILLPGCFRSHKKVAKVMLTSVFDNHTLI